MRFFPALCLLALTSTPTWADPFTITVTRFGSCAVLSDCQQTFTGTNSLTFTAPFVGEVGGGIFSVTGTVSEFDVASSVFLSLTNVTVQGLIGGLPAPTEIAGGIEIVSGGRVVSLNGVSGFASLNGQYQTNSGAGDIDFADLTLQANVGGITVGFVDGGTVTGVPSPDPFSGFNGRDFPSLVADNKLIGTLNFNIAPGDGFFLPGSADTFAEPTPEPSTLLLLGSGMLGAAAVKLRYMRSKERL
jgi:PEP-CTERM motif